MIGKVHYLLLFLVSSVALATGCAGKHNPDFDNYSAYSVLAADGVVLVEARGMHSLALGGGYTVEMPHELIKHLELALVSRSIQVTMPEAIDSQFFSRPKTGTEQYRVMVYIMRGTYKNRPTTGKLIYGVNFSGTTSADSGDLRRFNVMEILENENICSVLSPEECKKLVAKMVMDKVFPKVEQFFNDQIDK